MQSQLQALICSSFFIRYGFQSVEKTTIPAILKRISPDGGTAMRDSLIQGSKLMLKLHQALQQMNAESHWNFVHVILTDGADCNSNNSLQDAAKMMILIGKLIPVKALKIIFIGVGVEAQAEKQLQLLAQVGGQNAEYYNVNTSDISKVFNKIEIGLGIQRNVKMMGVTSNSGNAVFLQRQDTPYLQLNVKNFAVMFNLDVSGSMSGNKWNNVCSSVNTFISKLGGSDLVSGLVFNNQVKLLSNIEEDDKLFQRAKSNSSTTKVVMKTSSGVVTLSNNEECNIM